MIRLLLLGALLLLAGGQDRSLAQPVAVGSPGAPSAPPPGPQPRDPESAPVLEVTTDSRAYCQTLSRQIETYRPLPRTVRELQREGGTLCGEGQVRGGISRLRRALMAVRAEQQPMPVPP